MTATTIVVENAVADVMSFVETGALLCCTPPLPAKLPRVLPVTVAQKLAL